MARKANASPADTLKRTQVVTIRLDPKLKYFAELAARRQRRPLSSYIEWAVEQSLALVQPAYDPSEDHIPDTLKDVVPILWDIDEADRFVKLARRYPDLLNHEEQRLWKLIRENGYIWGAKFNEQKDEWVWNASLGSINWQRLREHWENFLNVARGQADPSVLPTCSKTKPPLTSDPEEIPS